MSIDNKTINDIIFSQFKQLPTTVQQVQMGVMTFKYKVKVSGLYFMLRIYPTANTTNVALEFKIMQQLFLRGCKVPEPVAYDNAGATSWLMYKYIEGQALSQSKMVASDATASIIAGQIVDNIIALSKEPIEGFGFLLSAQKSFNNWRDFLQDAIDKGEQHLTSIKEIDKVTIVMLLNFAKQQLQQINIQQSCLVWNDFSQDNIIIHNNNLAGFVDFEGCVAGDPIMALGYLFAIEGDSAFFKMVMAYYQKHFKFTYQTILFYALVRLFRLSKHINNDFPTGIKRDPLTVYFKGFIVAIEHIKKLSK